MSFLELETRGWIEILALAVLLAAAAAPLGRTVAYALQGERLFPLRLLLPLEKAVYRLCGIDPDEEMTALRYAKALLLFSLFGFLLLAALLAAQSFPDLSFDQIFNIAASFVTNTNWQSYAPETSLTATSQMAGLAVQNFLSAATGLAVFAALARGLSRAKRGTIGNFWVDIVRAVLYVLLPLSLLLALFLISQGVVQEFGASLAYRTLEGGAAESLALGPTASQVAIKMIGTNGGGFYGANAAHPFENPTPLSDFMQLFALMLLPASLPFAYGHMVRRPREGWALLAAMVLLLLPFLFLAPSLETHGNPALAPLGVEQSHGQMEGKEVRFGSFESALWGTLTAATSNGSVNASIDSFRPLSSLGPLVLMQLGEVVFGGVGSGLYGLLVFVLLAVFVSGLMIGRTPEYLGKKISVFEIKMASLAILVPALLTLGGASLAVLCLKAPAGAANPGPHGFTEILYAFTSAANNNGSAMGGLNAALPFYNVALGLCMLIGRFGIILPILAIAGSLSAKASLPPTPGTLETASPLFVGILIGVIVLIGVLTYVPALALGPVAAHLSLLAGAA